MDIQEAVAFADEVVFAKTGKHLDDMQVGVIEGVLKRQKYSDVGEVLNCTESYVKDVGYELWQLFSDAFGEEVNKSNLRSALLRKAIINSPRFSIFGDVGSGSTIGSQNICTSQESLEFSRGKQQAKIEALVRLKSLGLSSEQIAHCLDMTVEEIQQVVLTE